MGKEIKIVLEKMKKADKPLKTGEIVELSGLDKNDVAKAIKVLKADGLIDSPKRCFYQAK
jgi:DNA-binding MarR family transcriptional regulator